MSNSTDNNEALKQGSEKPADASLSSTNGGIAADSQIQAHRYQHQQKMKKLYAFIGIALLTLLLITVGYSLLTKSDNKQLDTSQSKGAALSKSEIEQYREAFKTALTEYETTVAPQLADIVFAGYMPAQTGDLALLKDSVLSSFARGEFRTSKANLEKLNDDSIVLIKQWKNEFKAHLESAKALFEEEQIPQSQLSLNKALALMPAEPGALALQNRLDAFAEIAILLKDLQVAKVERNLLKQIDLLSDIINLDPARNELNGDLSAVQSRYNQQQLAFAIESAEKAINQNRLADASHFIAKAKAIKPDSKGAQILAAKVAQLKADQSLANIKVAIKQAAEQDNWHEVQRLSTAALKSHSGEAELLNYQQQARRILSAKKALDGFIGRPNRLADQNIRTAAEETIQQSFSLSLASPSLQDKIVQLSSVIDNFASPVDVSITSDGKTYIVVVGVGHVGEHTNKSIKLTPGKYTLEGKRDGYRNKRLEFVVKANEPISLNLVCDERI